MRDPNRMVAMAAIRSPRITDSEIVKAASNRSVCEEVIRYIANQRDLTKNYQVKLSLVQNPKCPVALSLKFLPLLQRRRSEARGQVEERPRRAQHRRPPPAAANRKAGDSRWIKRRSRSIHRGPGRKHTVTQSMPSDPPPPDAKLRGGRAVARAAWA